MLTKTIDRSLCDACGECIRICRSSRVIAKGSDGLPEFAFDQRCILCGHCLAICPRGAISFTRDGGTSREEYYAEARVLEGQAGVPDPLLRLLFSLRSTRYFDGREVEREKVALVLEAMVRAASAGNEQNRSYYIYGTKQKVDELEADTQEYYRRTTAAFSNPLAVKLAAKALARKDMGRTVMRNRIIADLPKKERMSAYMGLFEDLAQRNKGESPLYFYNSSAAILVTSNTNTTELHKPFHKADVEIAVTHGTIAAAGLGLSTCRMGLSEMAFGRDKKLREKHGIPKNERVDGILAIGYSALRWRRIPPRGPVKAIWK